MRLVDDNRTELLNLWAEYHIFQSEVLAALDVPYEIFAQRLVIDDCDVVHTHLQEIRPCGACGVVEDESFLVRELLKFPLPVDFER